MQSPKDQIIDLVYDPATNQFDLPTVGEVKRFDVEHLVSAVKPVVQHSGKALRLAFSLAITGCVMYLLVRLVLFIVTLILRLF